MSNNKSNKAQGVPRSKEARQKLRRYSFVAEMKLENGQVAGYNIPGVVYGNHAEAKRTSDELLKQFLSREDAPQDTIIIPIAHETVSAATVQQLQGMNDQVNLFTKAAFVLAEKLRLAVSPEKELTTIVGEAVAEARTHLFPRLKEAQDKMAAINVEPVESAPRMKLGIDAVNEILNGPADPEAAA